MNHVNIFLKNNITFWSNQKAPELVDSLNSLVPASGEVKNKKENPVLEDWRKLSNAYYNFYNNGAGYGRALHFMFKRYGVEYKGTYDPAALETLANEVFLKALDEQEQAKLGEVDLDKSDS